MRLAFPFQGAIECPYACSHFPTDSATFSSYMPAVWAKRGTADYSIMLQECYQFSGFRAPDSNGAFSVLCRSAVASCRKHQSTIGTEFADAHPVGQFPSNLFVLVNIPNSRAFGTGLDENTMPIGPDGSMCHRL